MHLLGQKRPNGSWKSTIDVSAFLPAIYIIMLRSTELIARPGAHETEAHLMRHLITQINPDGGFYKYPGSPSSISVTRLALTAIQLVLGERIPRNQPQSRFSPNRSLDQDLLNKVKETARKSACFLRTKRNRSWRNFDMDCRLPELVLTAFLDKRRNFFLRLLFSPRLIAWLLRSRLASGLLSHCSTLLLQTLPAVALLLGTSQGQDMPAARPTASRKRSRLLFKQHQNPVDELINRILSRQNLDGAWFYNAPYTIFNTLALYKGGMALDSQPIVRSRAYLESSLFPTETGGMTVNFVDVDIWDTCMALLSYLMVPGCSTGDEAIRHSIEFLLRGQHEGGSYSWSSANDNEPDHDSTALAVRTLAVASRTAEEEMRPRIKEAIGKGVHWLRPRQDKRGGFSAWQSTFMKFRGKPDGSLRNYLFDMATPDVTARVLYAFVEAGLGPEDKTVQRSLSFLLKTQYRNGGWWCRWWAGYISGTDFVLDVFARMGLRWGPNPFKEKTLMARTHEAMMRGLRFVLSCQNDDGGWGETILADCHPRAAGKGRSRPLQTSSALFDLLACGYPADAEEIRRGYSHLLRTMKHGGRWEDNQATFTFFPKTYYYRYAFMSSIIPLNALTAYLAAAGSAIKA